MRLVGRRLVCVLTTIKGEDLSMCTARGTSEGGTRYDVQGEQCQVAD